MSEPDGTSKSEHELYLFKHIHEHLNALPKEKEGYKVITNTKLASRLNELASNPFASFVLRSLYNGYNFPIHVKGREAGTWMRPDVSVFQKHATIIDPSYGNGTELKAGDLTSLFHGSIHYQEVISIIKQNLRSAMFVGKELQVKLHKLAIYGQGGHVDWHRDTKHSDAHQGTVLFALNTESEGGEFLLRHEGVEVSINMRPTTIPSSPHKPRPVIVAFYTGMENKIMPVTKGVQLVLQYDVEVVGEQLSPSSRWECDKDEPLRETAWRAQRLERGSITTYSKPDNTLTQAVINEIQELHNNGTNIVTFPLFHLYRRASIKREYLRGNDSTLFNALKDHFDISINPVLIYYDELNRVPQGCIAYTYSTAPGKKQEESGPGKEASPGKESDSEEQSDHKDGYIYCHKKLGRVVEDASFHLHRASAIELILEQKLMVGLGADSDEQKGEKRYYCAGMFVKPTNEGVSSVHECERMGEWDGTP
ncbi:hypothetical protein M405DRAFT_934747 [Rhizopogon salebrosus TDB-379]|nr:hypothetical protein M405DRAFT_934747 [Rhizopogon salebrosus TDB-379]